MTKEEFEQGYAERSGVTVKWLHEQNLQGVPCSCGEKGCMGWQMVSTDHWEEYKKVMDLD